MNITELAIQLKTTPEKLKRKLPMLGFDIGEKAIKIDDKLVPKVIERWYQMERLEKRRKQLEEIRKKRLEERIRKKESGIIYIPEKIQVKQFAKLLNIEPVKLIADLLKNGVPVTLNEYLDFETACIIGEDYGVKLKKKQGVFIAEEEKEFTKEKKKKGKAKRPPIVVVMGHVDHGKTTLLDSIRNTNVVEQEKGGITQHIGAYQVDVDILGSNKKITFIDTPGHEAFSAMRIRGGKVADIAILVVAADDGVKPQTIEALNIIKREKLPFIVAINKIDKKESDPEKVKRELSDFGVNCEEWGGDTPFVLISAKKGIGIKELLETLILISEIEDIRCDIKAPVLGTVIESKIDEGLGPCPTVLIIQGTLKIGDMIKVGNTVGKVRRLIDWKGDEVSIVYPSTPVVVIGLKDNPNVGDILKEIENTKEYRNLLKKSFEKKIEVQESSEFKEKDLNFIIKTDVQGTAEAIEEVLKSLENKSIKINIVYKALGDISPADILQASATSSYILGFNIEVSKEVKEMALNHNIEIKIFNVIYDLVEYVKILIKKHIPEKFREVELGKVEVLRIFRKSKREMIIGAKVIQGEIKKGSNFRIFRNQELIGEGEVLQLQKNRKDVDKVISSQECGIRIKSQERIKEGDILEIFDLEKEEIKF